MPTMSATLTDAQWTRLRAVLAVADTNEANAWLVAFLGNMVKQHEQAAAEAAVAAPASW
jgi:hypothetical protein